MKKILIFLFLVTCYVLPVTSPSYAQEASISSGLSPDIKDKLQGLQAEIASKAAVLKTQVSKKLSNRAYVGTVKDLTENKITVSLSSGDKTITVNDDTDYFTKTGTSALKKVTLQTLSKGDFIAGLGDVDESEAMTAQRLIRYSTSPKLGKKVVWGRVQAVTKNTVVIVSRDNQTIEASIDSDTEISSLGKDVSLATIKQGAAVVISGSDGKTFNAYLIYLFPKK